MVSLLGQVRLTSASVFLNLVLPASVGVLSVCLRSVPLVLFASGVLCVSFSPGGFFFLGSLSRSVLLPSGPFLVPPGSCSFCPFWLFLAVVPWFLSSVSPSFQFSVPLLLTSSVPSVGGSLSPFLVRSSSLSPCFRLRLLRSVACPVLGLPTMAELLVGSCPFSFSVCLPSAMRCFFVAFLPSGFLPSRTLFPLPLSFLFIPPGLVLPFVSALFRWTLLWLSCLPSRLVCFTIGLSFSLLVPGFSFLLFSFSLCFFLLVPSFPPFSRWSFFSCLASTRLVRILWAVTHAVSSVVLSPISLCSGVFAHHLRLLFFSFSFLDLF